MVILYIVIFCWILYYFLAVHDSLWLLETEHEIYHLLIFYFIFFGLSNFNITPLLHIMLNLVGQHHTSWIFFMHLLIIRAIFKEFMHHLTHKFYIFFSLQVKCEILTCINSLKITYIPIIDCSQFEKDSYFRKQRKNNCSKIVIYIKM